MAGFDAGQVAAQSDCDGWLDQDKVVRLIRLRWPVLIRAKRLR